MQRPHTPVCGWAPETLLLHAHSGTVLQYHLPATPAWLTSVDGELTGWLAGWARPAGSAGWRPQRQPGPLLNAQPPHLPPAADCLLALAPSFTPASKQGQAHRLLAHNHCWRPASLQRHTNSPARDYQLQTAGGCPQSVAMRPVQGLKRAGEKLCPGHPEWGNTEWQSRGGVRRPGLCKRMQQQHRSALVV